MTLRYVVLLVLWGVPGYSALAEQDASQFSALDSTVDSQLYARALQSIAAGRPELALEQLERVVLFNPNHAGAWLDLALLHFRQGNDVAARQYLLHIQDQFVPDEAIQLLIEQVLARIDRRQWTHTGEISVLAGYNTNANGGTDTDTLSLETSLGELLLELSDEEQKQSAGFGELGVQWQYFRNNGQWRPGFMLGAASRQYSSGLSDQGHALALFQLDNTHVSMGALVAHVMPQSGNQYLRLGSWVEIPLSQSLSLNFNHSLNRHKAGADLDVSRYGLALKYRLRGLQLGLKAEAEEAEGTRTGGDQEALEWSAGYVFPIYQGRAALRYEGQLIHDRSGFNALINAGDPRKVNRHEFEIDWRRQVSRTFEIRLLGQYYHQNSNIDLFNTSGATLAAGVSWHW